MRLVGLSTSVCGTGTFSAHTATHSTSENAHETQSFSPKSLEAQNRTVITYYEDEVSPDEMVMCC